MADTKVSALTTQTDLATTDVFYMVDDPGGTPASKKIEAQYVSPVGKQTMWIPAAAMVATATAGCSNLNVVETTAGSPDMQVLDFNTTTQEHAQFQIAFPKQWDLGTVTFQAFWTASAGTGTVVWGLNGTAITDATTIDDPYTGSATTAADTLTTVEYVHVTAVSSSLTIDNTPAADDIVFFRIYRDVASDTLSDDARLIGIKLFYTINKTRDD